MEHESETGCEHDCDCDSDTDSDPEVLNNSQGFSGHKAINESTPFIGPVGSSHLPGGLCSYWTLGRPEKQESRSLYGG